MISCNRFCDPANIQNGKANQHHDLRPFRAKIISSKQYGHMAYVKYTNMKETTYRLYDNCSSRSFPVGKWVEVK